MVSVSYNNKPLTEHMHMNRIIIYQVHQTGINADETFFISLNKYKIYACNIENIIKVQSNMCTTPTCMYHYSISQFVDQWGCILFDKSVLIVMTFNIVAAPYVLAYHVLVLSTYSKG